MKISHKWLKPLNFLIPKNNRYVYAAPHPNGAKDCYDIINYSADNLLCLINYMLRNYNGKRLAIFLEYFDVSRLGKMKNYINSFNNQSLKFVFVQSHLSPCVKNRIVVAIKGALKRFRCKYWFADTGFVHYYEKVNRQKYINCNYSTPLKHVGAFSVDHDFSNTDVYYETSLMTACAHSAEFRVPLDNCAIIGFPRNDNLFINNKRQVIYDWIKSKTNIEFEKLIVYAPTYRDYNGAFETNCVFGFVDEDNKIYEYLKEKKILVVAKMHPLQKVYKSVFNDHIIEYEKNYDFTLYDMLGISDMLVSDYSSVLHDYILTKKPVLLDFFDQERYKDTRGFIFDPISYVCPGAICVDVESFIENMDKELKSKSRDENYIRVLEMFHKNKDNNSTKRAYEAFVKMINNE